MAIALGSSNISPPSVRELVAPVLSALPAAAVSTQPASILLPLLSPILRQRVQLLSSFNNEPWIRLLSYDPSKVAKLTEIAQRGELEPHPVSGEIEVDWDYDTQIRFKRLDQETLQTLVVLEGFDLFFRLVYCTGDKEGGGDGWRVGEVGVASDPPALSTFDGQQSVAEAERQFQSSTQSLKVNGGTARTYDPVAAEDNDDDDDDDDYWGRYDATPARTPATKRSPAPQSLQTSQPSPHRSASAEDAYYAQYDSVQPAMDNHDPDEEELARAHAVPPLGLSRPSVLNGVDSPGPSDLCETGGGWTLAEPPARSSSGSSRRAEELDQAAALVHPRPASSAGSNKSVSVAKLEEAAEKQEQGEFGVKQHVSRSIRSLFLLSRASGIDREEFERMVRTELDVLGMVEDEI